MSDSSRAGVQVEDGHYAALGYDTKQRFISYWHQIDAVLRRRPRRVLEVGKGNGFVSGYLRDRGVDVTCVDVDRGLLPDAVGRVEELPFPSASFDAVMCCQVLEHIPFTSVPGALAELRRVSGAHVVVSVPDVTGCIRVMLPRPGQPELQAILPRFWRRAPQAVTNKREHQWELGVQGHPVSRFAAELRAAGYRIDRTFRIFEHPYHRFYELGVR